MRIIKQRFWTCIIVDLMLKDNPTMHMLDGEDLKEKIRDQIKHLGYPLTSNAFDYELEDYVLWIYKEFMSNRSK